MADAPLPEATMMPSDDHLLSEDVDASFAYAVSGCYDGRRHKSLVCVPTEELAEFLNERREVLPERLAAWLADR